MESGVSIKPRVVAGTRPAPVLHTTLYFLARQSPFYRKTLRTIKKWRILLPLPPEKIFYEIKHAAAGSFFCLAGKGTRLAFYITDIGQVAVFAVEVQPVAY